MDDLSKGEPFTKNDDTDLINKPGNVKEVKTYKQGFIRWFVLFNACCFLIGSYFCYDNPGPIETTMESDLGISKP